MFFSIMMILLVTGEEAIFDIIINIYLRFYRLLNRLSILFMQNMMFELVLL